MEINNGVVNAMNEIRNDVYTEIEERFQNASDLNVALNEMIDETVGTLWIPDIKGWHAQPKLIWKLVALFSCAEVIFKSLGYANALRDLGVTSITQEQCSTTIKGDVCRLLLDLRDASLDKKEVKKDGRDEK